MAMIITPLHIQIALHYYAIAEPYAKTNPRHANSPAVKRCRAQLVLAGLLELYPEGYDGVKGTPKLDEYVQRLLEVKV